LLETGIVRRLGGEAFVWTVGQDDAAVGHTIKELGLPREALVNFIVRGDTAIPPRGSTEIEAGDELHTVVRQEALPEVEKLTELWRTGPLGEPPVPALPPRGAPQVFTVRPLRAEDRDPARPEELEGVAVAGRLRSRRDSPGALIALADGRYAVTGSGLVAVGPRRLLAQWAGRRTARPGISGEEQAWWQEVTGALGAPARAPQPTPE
jgi:potassium/hydrogen antiporter